MAACPGQDTVSQLEYSRVKSAEAVEQRSLQRPYTTRRAYRASMSRASMRHGHAVPQGAQHGRARPLDHRLRKEGLQCGSLLVCGVVSPSVSLDQDSFYC